MAAETPAIKAMADRVHKKLQEGNQGNQFDPTTIIAIIKAIMALFGGCALTPMQAHQRAVNVSLGRGAGHRLDHLRFRRVIQDTSSDDSQNDEIEAALLDSMDGTLSSDFAAMMTEANV